MILSIRKTHFEIAKNLRKGDILLWKKYKFPDGSQKSKYLLLLSDCIKGKFYIYILPTSKVGFYKNPSSQTDILWLPANQIRHFPLDTVIDLKQYQYERASQIGEGLYDNTLKRIGRLPDNVIKRIDNTVKSAKTLDVKTKNLILGNIKTVKKNK